MCLLKVMKEGTKKEKDAVITMMQYSDAEKTFLMMGRFYKQWLDYPKAIRDKVLDDIKGKNK